MKMHEAVKNIQKIIILDGSVEVVKTVAGEFKRIAPNAEIVVASSVDENMGKGAFLITDESSGILNDNEIKQFRQKNSEYLFFKIDGDGSGILAASQIYYLYSFAIYILENLLDEEIDLFTEGKLFSPSFLWNRTTYDFFLTQEGRIQRNLDRAEYVRELARLGFTHVEVNGLGFPKALESGPEGETYPMFYTYCPALDQFVYSELNEGLYPWDYLEKNLNYLKKNAQLARQYGLTPGLLCFEPRSVPEVFFDKYPMLRGARVDHPFRSFKPRYNMTITHPKVRAHYAEMLQKLMDEVPELGYITIWTNDSGAGFEHTKSLYVGRNGGAYMIREWKDDEEIARLAGENALKFFRVLREAGQEINPAFRVITRMESFYGEHDTVWNGMGNGLDVETSSLLAKGWEMPYRHPVYKDSSSINAGTIYQDEFNAEENTPLQDLQDRDGLSHYYFAAGPNSMFAPLIGVPYPNLTYKRLKLLYKNGVKYLSHTNGTCPPNLVPYNINHEVLGAFQFDPELNIDDFVLSKAKKWAGDNFGEELVKAWKLAEEAILHFPNITPLYSTFGFVWYRLWARPFVPNYETLHQDQKDYYENFMCTTPHNPNNVDLSRDVLFQLTTPEKSRLDVERIDNNVWKPLDQAIKILDTIKEKAVQEPGSNDSIIHDQWVRLKALHCWFMTQRNVAAWIAGVYRYMESENETEKTKNQDSIKDLINKEILNSEELIKLLESNVEFMTMTDIGETPLMYGDNLGELLIKRIELMKKHIDDEPFIDHNYIERKAGMMIE
ncbi:MAG: hypothetical protein P9L92_10435 [Candidatus Electryonea clarkiae]|nr:hypothetical protein [Candidatus Electryonea clarkiae]MDP8289142.1 hypothetical protein [Candidatus Electryonea clarkiae]